ncbi:hypothetical protein CEXT_562121 [Caerostris extrusa]|uniref:Uncharacterized protein n=1 Tax=Caerostris extrusa TaxID=172846 RepID=A0AAV4TIL9_CAEEX|nr:hypothetical protein CEXT_562121 [Caerostris extrusa]
MPPPGFEPEAWKDNWEFYESGSFGSGDLSSLETDGHWGKRENASDAYTKRNLAKESFPRTSVDWYVYFLEHSDVVE